MAGLELNPYGFNALRMCRWGPMIYNKNDAYVGRSLAKYGEYSWHEQNIFAQLLKPGAEIYRHALNDLGIAPSAAVFIDNRADNVRGAQELGITGHVFTDAAALRAFLESLAAT
jgi:beta-phosphoglucomutase-like phosphatase (HAD superfamily)